MAAKWTQELLMAHAMGALEPGDSLVVQEGLRRDASASFRLGGLEVASGVHRTGPLPLPLAARVDAAEMLSGDETLRVGDRLSLRVDLPVPPESARCILFRDTAQGRVRIHPRSAAWPTLDRFRNDAGVRVIDLVLEPPAGPQRFELVLVPADVFAEPCADEDPMWEASREARERGRLPGSVFEVTVEPAR